MLAILFIIAWLQSEDKEPEKPKTMFKVLNKWQQYSAWAKQSMQTKNNNV